MNILQSVPRIKVYSKDKTWFEILFFEKKLVLEHKHLPTHRISIEVIAPEYDYVGRDGDNLPDDFPCLLTVRDDGGKIRHDKTLSVGTRAIIRNLLRNHMLLGYCVC
jgi:hypothetical protein